MYKKVRLTSWSGESQHCRDARVYGHMNTVMHDMSTHTLVPGACREGCFGVHGFEYVSFSVNQHHAEI